MKIQTSTNVRLGLDGKRYHYPAGEHDVPEEVGEYLIRRGHAKPVPAEVEAPTVPAGARVIGQDAAVPVAAAPASEQVAAAPATEEETAAGDDLELDLDVDTATGDEPETESAPEEAQERPSGGRRGRRG
jgi:hypothetical protein